MRVQDSRKPRHRTTMLETLRRRRGWSQNELSRQSGVAVGAICSMERPVETGYVAGQTSISRLAAALDAHPSVVSKGQYGKFKCECCKGTGYRLELI